MSNSCFLFGFLNVELELQQRKGDVNCKIVMIEWNWHNFITKKYVIF